VYATRATCHDQVNGFSRSCYKRFPTKEEAVAALLEFQGCEDEKIVVQPPSESPSLVLVINDTKLLMSCVKCFELGISNM
jgi:viroplasmin and RNaseH domain-containing protein